MENNRREDESAKQKILYCALGAIAGVAFTSIVFLCSPPDVDYIKPFEKDGQKLMQLSRTGLDGIFVYDPNSGRYIPRGRSSISEYKNK